MNQVIAKYMLYLGCHQHVFTSYRRHNMLNLPEMFLRPPVDVVLKMFV